VRILNQLNLDHILVSMIEQSGAGHGVAGVPSKSENIERSSDPPMIPNPVVITDLEEEPDSWHTVMDSACKNQTIDSDRISLFSTPHFVIDSVNEELKNTRDLARTFFLSGELGNAELLFTKCMALMRKIEPTPKLLEKIQIRTQIAAIRLYRGRYQDANQEFESIKTEFDSFSGNYKSLEEVVEIEEEVKRWFAISLLLQGKYAKAVLALEDLLAAKSQIPAKASDIPVRRDLALAYGYLGYRSRAQQKIEEAERFWKDSVSCPGLA